MSQHPRVTVSWAINSLEAAIGKLHDGPVESRVRDQFHQLILALERDQFLVDSLPLRSLVLDQLH